MIRSGTGAAMLAAIEWVTPALLGGLALLVLPLIAHLLHKRSRQQVVFPTLQFLQEVSATSYRAFRLKRWLLLLLRGLAVCLLVLGFARPLWMSGSATEPDSAIGLVIVLDASLSTSRITDHVTAFDKLKLLSERAVNQLDPTRDFTNLVLATARPQVLLPRLTQNFAAACEILRKQHATLERADLHEAISQAVEQLSDFDGNKIVLIVSDFQQSNWEELLRGGLPDHPPNLEFRLAAVGTTSQSMNISLSDAKAVPPKPRTGQPVSFNVTVTNHSAARCQVPVTLTHGPTVEQRTIELEPRESAAVSFQKAFVTSSVDPFNFEIPADDLDGDNGAFGTLSPGQPARVALLADDALTEVGSTSFFVERALQPFSDSLDAFAVERFSSNDIREQALSEYDIVVVAYLAAIGQGEADELVRYVAQGGCLFWFCGAGDVSGNMQVINKAAGEQIFPCLAERLQAYPRFSAAPAIDIGRWQSVWLQAFDLQSQLALQRLRWRRIWMMSDPSRDAELLIQFTNGEPALARRTYDQGEVLVFNLNPTSRFGEFGKLGSFAAFMQMLAGVALKQLDQIPGAHTGESVVFDAPDPAPFGVSELEVRDAENRKLDFIVNQQSGRNALIVPRVESPGIVTLFGGDEAIQAIPVNADPRESLPESLDQQELAGLVTTPGDADLQAVSGSVQIRGSGQPLWHVLVLAALICLAFESLFTGRWR